MNIKLEIISLFIDNKVIPCGSIGTVLLNGIHKTEIEWNVEGELIKTTIPAHTYITLRQGRIIVEIKDESEKRKPLFKEGELIKHKDYSDYYFIMECSYNAAEDKYIYKLLNIYDALTIKVDYDSDYIVYKAEENNLEKVNEAEISLCMDNNINYQLKIERKDNKK